MKDIFLKSDTREHIVEDLFNVSNAFIVKDDGGNDQFAYGHGFAICYCGVLAKPGTGSFDEDGNQLTPVEFYDGVHCNVRVWGEHENLFDSFSSEFTEVIHPSTPCVVFG